MDRSDYLSALVRGWWLIVVLGLVGLAVGLLLPREQPTSFFFTTSEVGSPPPATASDSSSLISPDQILYYGGTDTVLAAASKGSGLNWPTWLVRDQISLVGPPSADGTDPGSGQPGVVDVKAGAPTAAESLNLNKAYDDALGNQVNAVAKQALETNESATEAKLAAIYSELLSNKVPPGVTPQALDVQISALQNELAGFVVSEPYTGFEVLHTPVVHEVNKVTTSSIFGNREVRAVAGLLIGLVVGALLALAMWLLDRRLKTAKRAQLAFGYPVAAEIPAASSDSTEPYRMLWLSVFREPLPLPPEDESERWYDGEDPVLDRGGIRSDRVEIP
jgi:hypothetical protein